jgi:uncharacterized membrane protein (DUF2068 family)
MPGHPLPRAAGNDRVARPGYRHRLVADLRRRSEPPDIVVKLIIVERLGRGVLLIAVAITTLVLGRKGVLAQWAETAQVELNLQAGNVFQRLLEVVIVRVASARHLTELALGVILFSALEMTEGVGLATSRRWAEYLTVVATSVGIPYEVFEVITKPTLFKAAALLVNVAVVGYLAYRKRLFVGV